MAVVLALIAVGLYLRFEARARRDDRPRAARTGRDVSAVRPAPRQPAWARGRAPLVDRDERFAQILALDGRSSTPPRRCAPRRC